MTVSATDKAAVAFAGSREIACGGLREVALAAKRVVEAGGEANVLVLDATTSEMIEVDFRGDDDGMLTRLAGMYGPRAAAAAVPRGPGRPKLGVVAREVTLLPRHWEWLAQQPGGASVALRKLVDEARRTHGDQDRLRQAREATYRFMSTMAGDNVGFEESTRALFAGDRDRFVSLAERWPADVARHVMRLAEEAFASTSPTAE